MDKLCKQYISNICFLFPVIGKQEKQYLKKLQNNMLDYFQDHDIHSIDELYEEFGSPEEIINSYYINADIDYITKHIRQTKLLRRCLITIIALMAIATLVFSIYMYTSYQFIEDNRIYYEETVIEQE